MRILLTLWLTLAALLASAQEVVRAPVKQLPEAKGQADIDVEFGYASGAVKLQDVCVKLKGKLARSTFGCDKAASLKDAKKIWEKNEESSAWEALAALDEAKFGKAETAAFADQVMEDALGSVKIQGGKLNFGKVSPAETTGRLIFACSRLHECLKRTLTAEERIAVSDYLLTVEPITSGVALGLAALSEFGMVSVSVKQEKNSQSAIIRANSLTGKPLKWKSGKGTSPLVSVKSDDEVTVTFDSKGKLAKVPVELDLPANLKHIIFLQFEVIASFGPAKVLVKDKSIVKSESVVQAPPSSLDKPVLVDKGEFLELSVPVSSGSTVLCPEQAVFGFISADGSSQYLVPGTCSSTEVRVSIPNGAKLGEELKYTSGVYDVVFIASDERMSNPLMWRLARAQLSLSPLPEKKHEPLFTRHLLYESDTAIKTLPEIHHQFRQPDRRAPILLSLIFSSAQVGLLLALFVNLVLVGFKPVDVFKSVRVMFFAATLGLVELVFAWYWIAPSGAPNMESLAYKYLPPLITLLVAATRNVISGARGGGGSNKKTASM